MHRGIHRTANYTVAQWRAACVIDTGKGDPDSKSRYRLPVRELAARFQDEVSPPRPAD
jgi:hypothetical protein